MVDDATVEIENIHRNLHLGKGLTRSILDGAQQIAMHDEKNAEDPDEANALKEFNLLDQECKDLLEVAEEIDDEHFIELVQKEVGFSFKVISPKEEARLAVVGALDLIDPKKEVALVVDMRNTIEEAIYCVVRVAL